MMHTISSRREYTEPSFLGTYSLAEPESADSPEEYPLNQADHEYDQCPPVVKCTPSVYDSILRKLEWSGREQGGLLVGPTNEPLVTHFLSDDRAVTTHSTFELDAPRLNAMLRPFLALDMDCKGIVHSHPPGVTSPSIGDQEYVKRSLGNPRNERAHVFFLPIVCDGRLYPWVISRNDLADVQMAQLILV